MKCRQVIWLPMAITALFVIISCDNGTTENYLTNGKHQWCEWTVIVLPTQSTPGEEERICIKCYVKEKRILYIIGNTGPGGGIIFYDKGYYSDGWRYLEGGRDIFYDIKWASEAHYITNIIGTGKGVGTGKENTNKILSIDANAPAALTARNYRVTGFENITDWFLPSMYELVELYRQRYYFNVTIGWFGWF